MPRSKRLSLLPTFLSLLELDPHVSMWGAEINSVTSTLPVQVPNLDKELEL